MADSEKIKVLEVMTYSFEHGGIEAFLINLIKNYDFSGTQMDLMCLDTFSNEYARSVFENKKINIITRNKHNSLLKKIKYFNCYLKTEQYDVVHIHSTEIRLFIFLALTAKLNGIKRVILHSHSAGKTDIKHYVIKAISWFVYPFVTDEYLACSFEAGKKKYPKYVLKNKLKIIKNGIDLSIFYLNNNKRSEYRKLLGISEDEILIGHVGRFSEEKNHKFIIELFAELKNESDKYKLILIGDGELADKIKKQAEELNLTDGIIFTGIVNNVQDYMQAIDISILPSFFEGLPLTSIETQACGLPLIASTGVPEESKLTENVLFLPLEIKEWVNAINNYSSVPKSDNINTIRKSGYDIKDTASKIKNIYSSIQYN